MTTKDSINHEPSTKGPNWTVMDIGSIIVLLSGAVFTLLPWGVFQTRLEDVDILLMLTPAFILVGAILAYAGTVLTKKTTGTRNKVVALTARILVWASILGLLGPIIVKFFLLTFAP
jgi:hypothetical protein